MQLPDVNVLVYAARPESPQHAEYHDWLTHLVNGVSDFAVADTVLASFVRLVTNPRIFRTPTPVDQAADFVDQIVGAPGCRVVRPGPRHLTIFLDLCRSLRLRGDDVPDGYLAALAIESGAELVTADRGFARFPGLRWAHPLD